MRHADSSPPPSSTSPPSPGAPAPSATPTPPAAAPAKRPPRLALLIATGFGLGYLPKAPGTWGSLGGVALIWCLWLLANQPPPAGAWIFPPPWVAFTALLLWVNPFVLLLGAWAAGRSCRFLGEKDPQIIVVDEISGQMLAFVGLAMAMSGYELAFDWQYLLAGFILFRVFDIWKPWPVRAAEKLPGGWGIMADDWVAGIYAALCLWALRALGL